MLDIRNLNERVHPLVSVSAVSAFLVFLAFFEMSFA
jgi:hypothetical protein